VNEALWAGGMATLAQRYSVRGLDVVAGLNISSTISNVFNIVFIAVGSSIAIIVGQLLGANKMKEAKETAGKLIFFSVICCMAIGCIMALTSSAFPQIYNTSDEVKNLAQKFILIAAVMMPLNAFTHASYFTLRSGGKTIITFLFDSVFVWTVCIPMAFLLTTNTDLPIIPIYIICQSLELIKCAIGFILVKKGVWLNNMVADKA
jgi:Na+-driven multidrug efflux pump